MENVQTAITSPTNSDMFKPLLFIYTALTSIGLVFAIDIHEPAMLFGIILLGLVAGVSRLFNRVIAARDEGKQLRMDLIETAASIVTSVFMAWLFAIVTATVWDTDKAGFVYIAGGVGGYFGREVSAALIILVPKMLSKTIESKTGASLSDADIEKIHKTLDAPKK